MYEHSKKPKFRNSAKFYKSNLDEDLLKTIEPTPELTKPTCRLLSYLVAGGIYALPFVFALLGYVFYDAFIAFCSLCFGYLVNGVIHSKMRLLSIPNDQREISFNSYEISRWFVKRYLVCE